MGEILVSEGIINQEQVEEALEIQRKTGELLGLILMDMGIVSESDIAKIISTQYQLPFICLANYQADEKLVKLFPKEFLHKNRLIPFDKVGEMLLMIVCEIPPEKVLEEIPKLTHLNAALYVGYCSEVMKFLQTHAPLEGAPASSTAAKGGGQPATAARGPRTTIEITNSGKVADEALEDEFAGGDLEDGEGGMVFGANKQSFLAELDSTWNSIFDEALKDGKKSVRKAKSDESDDQD